MRAAAYQIHSPFKVLGPCQFQHFHSKRLLTVCSVLQQSQKPTEAPFYGIDVNKLLSRPWLLPTPEVPITRVDDHGAVFSVIRDDLSHPFVAGNKRRKLDAIWPELQRRGIKDVVTCGGLQSAHTLAVAAAASESNTGRMRAHLIVRGERPAVPTGNHLYTRMFAHHVKYVSREQYSNREAIFEDYLKRHKLSIATTAVIPEGGAEVPALLGLIRMVHWLANKVLPKNSPCTLVIDSGTGTSAIGLALGAALMDLPWTVSGVMLCGPLEYYEQEAVALVAGFCEQYKVKDNSTALMDAVRQRLVWVERLEPRAFGKVLPGEVQKCQIIAQNHSGIVVDPMWTLASWQVAEVQARRQENVMMVHTGGALGLCGLAQRWPEEFYK